MVQNKQKVDSEDVQILKDKIRDIREELCNKIEELRDKDDDSNMCWFD